MTCQLYRHYDEHGQLLYVGISFSAIARAAAHRDESDWFWRSRTMTIENYPSRDKARAAEVAAIKRERPIFNRCHVLAQSGGGASARAKFPDLKAAARDLADQREQAIRRHEHCLKLLREQEAQALEQEFQCRIEKIRSEYQRERRHLRRLKAAIDALGGKITTHRHILWQLDRQYEPQALALKAPQAPQKDNSAPPERSTGIFWRLGAWLRSPARHHEDASRGAACQ